MMLGQKKKNHGAHVRVNVTVRYWEVFKMNRRVGRTSSSMFIGNLERVTQLIDKVVDGLKRLNKE